MSDAYQAYVTTLLNFEGVDGSTTIPNTPGPQFTCYGNAHVEADAAKFGSSCLQLDGSGDYIRASANAAFGFGLRDFTIEAFVYLTASPLSDAQIFDFRSAASTPGLFYIDGADGRKLAYYDTSARKSTNGVSLNQWVHIAFSRSGTSICGFIDGVKEIEFTATIDFTASRQLTIGASFNNTNGFTGYIDAVRITHGYARYTTEFTPPSATYDYTEELSGGWALTEVDMSAMTVRGSATIDLTATTAVFHSMQSSTVGGNLLHNFDQDFISAGFAAIAFKRTAANSYYDDDRTDAGLVIYFAADVVPADQAASSGSWHYQKLHSGPLGSNYLEIHTTKNVAGGWVVTYVDNGAARTSVTFTNYSNFTTDEVNGSQYIYIFVRWDDGNTTIDVLGANGTLRRQCTLASKPTIGRATTNNLTTAFHFHNYLNDTASTRETISAFHTIGILPVVIDTAVGYLDLTGYGAEPAVAVTLSTILGRLSLTGSPASVLTGPSLLVPAHMWPGYSSDGASISIPLTALPLLTSAAADASFGDWRQLFQAICASVDGRLAVTRPVVQPLGTSLFSLENWVCNDARFGRHMKRSFCITFTVNPPLANIIVED